MYLEFRFTQDVASVVETKDKFSKYATVTYKYSSADSFKDMQDINSPEYTDPQDTMDPTHRVAYKKWDHKFNHYDEILQNLDNNKKK